MAVQKVEKNGEQRPTIKTALTWTINRQCYTYTVSIIIGILVCTILGINIGIAINIIAP